MTKYYSRSKGKFIDIANMPDQYVRNAFVKMCSTDAIEDVIYATQQKERADKYKKLAEDNFISSVNDSETSLQGCYYNFSEVPQDEEGKEFVKNCRKYLNRESYTIRVRGQHLKKELHGQGRAYWGANMEDSSHMRVYIDKKKGDK